MSTADFIQEDCALWERVITPALGARARNQFIAATRRQHHIFADRFVRPQLFRPDTGVYLPVDISTQTPGRNHFLAKSLATDRAAYDHLQSDPLVGLTYFANMLAIGKQVFDPLTNAAEWERPSERVVLGDLHAFTFEFDVPGPEFLKHQLSWLRSSGNLLQCPVGDLYRHLSSYADFAGLTVAYSGNKSLHFHLVFDTTLARKELGLDEAHEVRRGLMAHWDDLHGEVLQRLGVPEDILADWSLRAPETYRRLPGGSRGIDKDGQILGLPVGAVVPQVALWEQWRDRAQAGADALFFRPEPFFASPQRERSKRAAPRSYAAKSSATFNTVLSPEEMSYCEAKLLALYPAAPRFERLSFENGRWAARFSNSTSDRNPSSIMIGEHNAVLLQGRDAAGLSPAKLPLPLAAMIRLWINAFRREQAAAEWEEVDWIVPSHRVEAPPLHEAAFSAAATDYASASKQARQFLRKVVSSNSCALVCGPEGVRKTSSLFIDHHRLQGALEAQGGPRLSMYAFADYAAAEAKCAAFNDVQAVHRRSYHGVVVPSFTRAYEEACQKLGFKPLSAEAAAQAGYSNLWAAVAALQPSQVLGVIQQAHGAMWSQIGDRRPVFFAVHDVAQRWSMATPTRVMWARNFWIGRMDDPGHVRDCRRSTALGLLVHDEVSAEDLVALHRSEAVGWVAALREHDPVVWSGRRGDLAAQFNSYRKFAALAPMPVVAGQPIAISFNEAREIASIRAGRWEAVETRCSGEYGQAGDGEEDDGDIYAARLGTKWSVAPRGWWRGMAERVVVLTTEAVPTEVARRLAPDWSVHEMTTPHLPRDSVETYPQRGITGGRLVNVVADYQKDHPSLTVISNKVAALPHTITHLGARGSNDFIGRSLAQTMTFLTPEEYERLEALNAWTGRSDLIRLRHLDQFNQSAGRNLGFRKQGDVRHDLLINRRLLGLLMGDVLARSRYDFRLHLGRDRRYEIKVRAA